METSKYEDLKNTPDEDKTFNRMKELQALLKKESALKELCN